MQKVKTEKPIESPGTTAVDRLLSTLASEGFVPLDEAGDLTDERIYRREEKILFARGETVFVLLEQPVLTEAVMARAVQNITSLFKARNRAQKVLSVLQMNTIYVCLVTKSDFPHTDSLARYITSSGGAVVIPVVLVPEINHVVYPHLEERMGSVGPRVEYLRYLLGETLEIPKMHRQTIQAAYISAAVVALLVLGVVFSLVT